MAKTKKIFPLFISKHALYVAFFCWRAHLSNFMNLELFRRHLKQQTDRQTGIDID